MEKRTKIQILNRIVTVIDSYEKVCLDVEKNNWIEVTEHTSFHGELSGKTHEKTNKIKINTAHIIEIYES